MRVTPWASVFRMPSAAPAITAVSASSPGITHLEKRSTPFSTPSDTMPSVSARYSSIHPTGSQPAARKASKYPSCAAAAPPPSRYAAAYFRIHPPITIYVHSTSPVAARLMPPRNPQPRRIFPNARSALHCVRRPTAMSVASSANPNVATSTAYTTRNSPPPLRAAR